MFQPLIIIYRRGNTVLNQLGLHQFIGHYLITLDPGVNIHSITDRLTDRQTVYVIGKENLNQQSYRLLFAALLTDIKCHK